MKPYSFFAILLAVFFVVSSCEEETVVESISLSSTNLEMPIGTSQTLVASIMPQDVENVTLTWTSSNEDIAIVDGNGSVTALKSGTTIIIVKTSNNISASCVITVVRPLTGMSIVQPSFTLDQGDTTRLIVNYMPKDATNKNIYWTSSSSHIAMVNDFGLVTGISPGVATITATSVEGGFTSTCEITVEEIPVDLYYTSQGQYLYENDVLYMIGNMTMSELVVSDGKDFYTEAFNGTYFKNGVELAYDKFIDNRFVELCLSNEILYSCSYGPDGVFIHIVKESKVETIRLSTDDSAIATGIAVDSNLNIFVGGNMVDKSGRNINVVWRYEMETGKVTRTFLCEGLTGASVSVDDKDNVYALADMSTATGSSLQLYLNGEPYKTLTTKLYASKEYVDNKSMTFKNGNLYIAASAYTSGDPQILVWRNNEWIYTMASTNSEIKLVTDVDVDSHGNVYVSGYDSANGIHGSIWINGGELYFYDSFFIRNIAVIE